MDARLWKILTESFMKILIPGIKVTLPLTVLSFALALVISVVVAIVQYADIKVAKQFVRFYIWIIRGTPLLVQLYIFFFGLPSLGIKMDAFPCAILVFGINEGAYMAESMRAAFIRIDRLVISPCRANEDHETL